MQLVVDQIVQLLVIVMAALWAGHYILPLWFLSFSFFPCLFSVVADWMLI